MNPFRHPRHVSGITGLAGFVMVVNLLGVHLVYVGNILLLLFVVVCEWREPVNRFGPEYKEYRARALRFSAKRKDHQRPHHGCRA